MGYDESEGNGLDVTCSWYIVHDTDGNELKRSGFCEATPFFVCIECMIL